MSRLIDGLDCRVNRIVCLSNRLAKLCDHLSKSYKIYQKKNKNLVVKRLLDDVLCSYSTASVSGRNFSLRLLMAVISKARENVFGADGDAFRAINALVFAPSSSYR